MKLHGIEITPQTARIVLTKYGTKLLRVNLPNTVDPSHRQDHAEYRYAYYDVTEELDGSYKVGNSTK